MPSVSCGRRAPLLPVTTVVAVAETLNAGAPFLVEPTVAVLLSVVPAGAVTVPLMVTVQVALPGRSGGVPGLQVTRLLLWVQLAVGDPPSVLVSTSPDIPFTWSVRLTLEMAEPPVFVTTMV